VALGNPGRCVGLSLVEGLVLEPSLSQPVELTAVLGQRGVRLGVAVTGDPLDLLASSIPATSANVVRCSFGLVLVGLGLADAAEHPPATADRAGGPAHHRR
jgi:hypothetical protein